jgi:hypothetical protein
MTEFLRNTGIYQTTQFHLSWDNSSGTVSRLMRNSSGMTVSIYHTTQCHFMKEFLRNASIYYESRQCNISWDSSSAIPVSIYQNKQYHVSWDNSSGMPVSVYRTTRCHVSWESVNVQNNAFLVWVQQSFNFQARLDRPFSSGVCVSLITFSSSLFPTSLPTTHHEIILRMVLNFPMT